MTSENAVLLSDSNLGGIRGSSAGGIPQFLAKS